ncbi:hypothetical protein [Winogradskya humida]|uniref:Minor tail protein n=1 Tax=Winogradskya humida TaxID=113566 RepID=A0ABQ4A765_9ACTN|nr:hypothetical protein [Actinoplanes humidus]GIE26701.1 hypothetical protein Ahu01nite_098030 [Actinoplanes humidus]
MAGTITTTTDATALDFPGQSFIDTKVKSGGTSLFAVTLLGTQLNIWRSANSGAGAWAAQPGMALTRAGIQELGGWFVDVFGYGHLTYRVYEGGRDRIMYRRVNLESNPNAWGGELMVCEAITGAAGQVYTGSDLVAIKAGQACIVAIAAAFTQGATQGVELHAFRITTGQAFPSSSPRATAEVFAGTRKWTWSGSGRQTPVVEVQHGEDGHTAPSPHLWVVMGRTRVLAAHLIWSGSRWTGPAAAAPIDNTQVPQDSIAARWTSERLVVAGVLAASPDAVSLVVRDSSNAWSSTRSTPVHPAGNIRSKAISYDWMTRLPRIWAVGTSSNLLYYIDQTGEGWTDWALFSTTPLQDYRSYGVRRGSWGNLRYDLLWEPAGSSPYSLVHVQQTLAYPPDTPDWTYPTPASGSAVNVGDALQLNFTFSDPDPQDVQTGYALSRQVGTGVVQYWRESDRSWQNVEIKNATGSNYVELAAGWGAFADSPHAYRARVWDGNDSGSAYSQPIIVIPSAPAEPVLTQPVDGTVWTAEALNATWTVAEQTAHTERLFATFDDFQRAGVQPGRMGQGYTATTPVAAYTVAAGVLTISVDAVGSLRRIRADPQWASRELALEFQVPVMPAGAPVRVELMMAWNTGPTFVGASVTVTPTGQVVLNLARSVNNVLTLVGGATIFPTGGHATTRWYGLRVRYTGSYEAKLWDAAGPEPTTWDLIATAEALGGEPAPGGIAVQAWLDTGNTNALPVAVRFRQWTRGVTDLVYDSGWTQDSAIRQTVVPYSLPNNSAYVLELQTRNVQGLPSDIESARIVVDYIEPPQPTLQVTALPELGLNRIAVTTPSPSGQTLPNPGFETTLAGWVGTNATITRTTAQAHSGSWSVLLTPDGVGASPRIEIPPGQRIPVVPGQSMTAEAWIRPGPGTPPVLIGINWFDASDVYLSTTATALPASQDEWQFITVTGNAPAGAALASIHAGLADTPAPAQRAHIDDMRLAPTTGQPATASVDVYRAIAGDPSSVIRIATGLPQQPVIEDKTAVSGVDYRYLARAFGTNGARIDSPWT